MTWSAAWIGALLCVVVAIIDWRTGQIPNYLTYPTLILAPVAHAVLAWGLGGSLREALQHGATSLLGALVCGVVPLYLWLRGGLGGGDVKLFAALGALTLPRIGFELEGLVFCAALCVAPIQLALTGELGRFGRRLGHRVRNAFRPQAERVPASDESATWFRLGPCFVVGFAAEVLLRGGTSW